MTSPAFRRGYPYLERVMFGLGECPVCRGRCTAGACPGCGLIRNCLRCGYGQTADDCDCEACTCICCEWQHSWAGEQPSGRRCAYCLQHSRG